MFFEITYTNWTTKSILKKWIGIQTRISAQNTQDKKSKTSFCILWRLVVWQVLRRQKKVEAKSAIRGLLKVIVQTRICIQLRHAPSIKTFSKLKCTEIFFICQTLLVLLQLYFFPLIFLHLRLRILQCYSFVSQNI